MNVRMLIALNISFIYYFDELLTYLYILIDVIMNR